MSLSKWRAMRDGEIGTCAEHALWFLVNDALPKPTRPPQMAAPSVMHNCTKSSVGKAQ